MSWVVMVLAFIVVAGIVFMADIYSEINTIKYRLENGLVNVRKPTKPVKAKKGARK